jgi:hypothetical protein
MFGAKITCVQKELLEYKCVTWLSSGPKTLYLGQCQIPGKREWQYHMIS